MGEAWQAREAAQQEFIRERVREVHDWTDGEQWKCYELAVIELCIALLARFRAEIAPDRAAAMPVQTGGTPLVNQITTKIRAFARVPPEERYLFYALFNRLLPGVASWAGHDYRHEAIMNPAAVYGAPSAMTEVND